MQTDFKVHTLGCASAKPSLRHNPSCTVVDYRGNLFMVDCGEGAQRTFQKQRLSFSRLQHIFLTHMHGDHVFGLPGLVGTLDLSGVGGDLYIHTFEDGAEMLDKILKYFSRDMDLKVHFDVIRPEERVILETPALKVKTIPLEHRTPTVGYVFEEKPKERHIIREMTDFHKVPVSWMRRLKQGEDFLREDGRVIPNEVLTSDADPVRSYAHISDTRYMPDLAQKLQGVNLLYHESTYLDELRDKAEARCHTTAKQAAMVARDANAGELLIGHYSSRCKDDEAYAREARTIFPRVTAANEGLTMIVK